MSAEVSAVTFRNERGYALHGILHVPATPIRDTGVILLSPGIKNRVAPHRMYVKLARCFTDLGFPTLRFDPEGLGDSEGEIEVDLTADLYGSIQLGRFVEDTKRAMGWMEERVGCSSFVLSGLCGGAITGLLSGAGDERVSGLVGLGIPVILDSSTIDHSRYITTGELEAHREGYFRNLRDIRSWLRLLTFRSDYRMIFKSLFGRKSKSPDPLEESIEDAGDQTASAEDGGNLNPHFPAAFHRMIGSSARMLLIFSEADRLYWYFQERFLDRNRSSLEPYRDRFEIHLEPNANHILTFTEWQDNVMEKIRDWAVIHYGPPPPVA